MEQRLSSPRQPLAQRLAFGGLFLALGILFPLLFHLLPARSGEIFLPMHIPVILAGMVLGPALGAAVGALTPLLNTLVGSMPPPRPSALYDGRACGFCPCFGTLFK